MPPSSSASDAAAAERVKRQNEATALADLFFKADKVLSDAEEARTNTLRLNYRKWRLGEGSAGVHADVLALNHAASTSESRSGAKMKRVRTVGDHVCSLANESGSSWSRATSPGHSGTQVPRLSPAACIARDAGSGLARAARAGWLVLQRCFPGSWEGGCFESAKPC